MNLSKLISLMRTRGYLINTRPFELNLVAVRNNTVRSERMDDRLYVFYADDNAKWHLSEYVVTTDPSAYYIDHPIVPQGYGFIKAGQYHHAYAKGYHKGRKALIQIRPITVIRNYQLKGLWQHPTGKEQTGIFGNNIHDMKGSMFNASAGCIVFADYKKFEALIFLVDQQYDRYQNTYTLTLLDHRDEHKRILKNVALGTLLVGSAATAAYALSDR